MASQKVWIGISDLMSVLMIVFLFIAVLFMLKVQDDQREMQRQHEAMAAVARAYDESQNALRGRLEEAFSQRLAQWRAEILPNGAVRFNHPQSLFRAGSAELSAEFRGVLADFFPRYVAMLYSEEWRSEIEAVWIEGHTSSDWRGDAEVGEEARYLGNARLSQERAYAVLEYVYGLAPEAAPARRMWLRGVLRATGASYAVPVLRGGEGGEEAVEDRDKSRRVEFHVMTRADEALYEILRQLRAGGGG